MKQSLTMKQILERYEDEFREFACGENNREELLEQFIEKKGFRLRKVGNIDLDDICVVCGVYVAEGAHVCSHCRRRGGDEYEE